MATKTLNIALDETLLRQVDAVVKEDLASRSEYFRRLALADLARRKTLARILDAGNAKGKALGFATEEDALQATSR
jgi:metal-responsive CopG/Arc/MetJ family transcriptional regulator